ncbi:hypothetical protein [Georgenia wangjunii]|uniref:hypothetical protein n=1 Tax=Georgenia wangjunii TaxID=3117730 RepID=UPI002F2681DE
MMIDCDSCTMKDIACDDCVVTFLTIPLGPPAAAPGRPRALAPPGAAGTAAGGGAATAGAPHAPAGTGDRSQDAGRAGAHPPHGGWAGSGDLPGCGGPPSPWEAGADLGEDERTAIAVLAGSGLVPPLRMVPAGAGAQPAEDRVGRPGGPPTRAQEPVVRSAAASA